MTSLVIAEHDNTSIKGATRSAITAARQVGGDIHVLVAGHGCSGAAAAAARIAGVTKVLVAEMTLTDPEFYTQPVKAEKKWAFVPNGHLLPYECAEESWLKRLEELEQKTKAAK